ncbi:MAG: hypothetical protein NC489_46780, partial [Ruminococcus flavefaciens]|nr:hypothetical protein [Ruminococcus flavefaciens]
MKISKRYLIIFCSTLILFSNLYMCYSIPVYAKPTMDDNGHLHVYNWDDIKDCATDWVMKMAADIGAVFFDHNFAQYVENKEAWVNYWTEDNVKVNEDGTNVTFTADLMAFIKQCVEQYAKENEPYYMVNTLTLDDFGTNLYTDYKKFYDTAKNLIEDSPSGVIALGAQYDRPYSMYFADIGNYFTAYSPVKEMRDDRITFYNNETWNQSYFAVYALTLRDGDEVIKTADEFKEKSSGQFNYSDYKNWPIEYIFKVFPIGISLPSYPYDCSNGNSSLVLITKDRRRIRVFNTYGDFQNY